MSQVYQGGVLYINGLPVAHAGPGGHTVAQEECWVTIGGQKVKQVFTNIAHATDLENTTQQIFTDGYRIATKRSFASTSYGDESSEGGVKSGTVQGEMRFLSASPNVRFEGSPVVRHSDLTISNNENTEQSTWVQPSKPTDALGNLLSDPIEDLDKPSAVNIQLIRKPEGQFSPAPVQQFFMVEHQDTGHKTYHTFGVFKEHENQFLWHGDFLREGSYQVYEVFKQQGNKVMQLPLGQVQAVAKDDYTPGIKLVPLTFRRYDDMQSSHEAAKKPYPNTYIYLFKDGFLWREFHINLLGRMYEVDLPYFSPEKLRYASAELTQGILLPIEDAQGKHEFQVAVSHLQWSWDYIKRMGGVDPKDKRFKPEHILREVNSDTLKKQRLQTIEIASLISSGEICATIDLSQTQDEITAAIHPCQLPESNIEWVIDRDKFNHSRGINHPRNGLAWASLETTPPPFARPDSPDGKKITQLPGSAIFIFNDPLGRLIEAAEFLVDEHLKYSAILEEELQTYMLAQLMGQVLEGDSKNQANYLKQFDNAQRLKFMKNFESKRESYQALMKEGTVLIKYWFEKTKDLGQWKDFFEVADDPSRFRSTTDSFRQITENIFAAFALTPEGQLYFQEEVKQTGSVLVSMQQETLKWLSIENSFSLMKNMLGLMAATSLVTEESLQEMLKYYNQASQTQIQARLVEIPESQLIAHHKQILLEKEPAVTTSLRVEGGRVIRLNLDSPPSTKMIKIVEIEGMPAYQTQALVSSLERPLTQTDKIQFKLLTEKAGGPTALRGLLAGLMIFNTRALIEQIDQLQAQGLLQEGMLTVYHAEIMRNVVMISELSISSVGLMTYKVSRKKLVDGAMVLAKRLSYLSLYAVVAVDWWNIKVSQKDGDHELMTTYSLSIAGTLLMYFATIGRSLVLSRTFGITGLAMSALAILGVLYFTKSDFEKWFNRSIWGRKQGLKDKPLHSIEWFYFMVPHVRVLSFIPKDMNGHPILFPHERSSNRGFNLNPEYMLRPAEEFQWSFQVPAKEGLRIELTVLSLTGNGLVELSDKHLHIETELEIDGLTNWKVRFSSGYFPVHGTLGKIVFKVLDSSTGALIGRDAYEFSLNLIESAYEYRRVRYGA